MDLFVPHSCPSVGAGAFEQQFPIGVGYIPWQTWSRTYPQEQALMRGTIFPDLDLPFEYRRCRR